MGTPSTSGTSVETSGGGSRSADLSETEAGARGTDSADTSASEAPVASSAAPSREGQGSGNETSGGSIWTLRTGAAAPAAGGGTGGGGDPDPPPPPPPPTMPFADENGVDTDDVTTRADGIKVPY